jgi:hypothetical protein
MVILFATISAFTQEIMLAEWGYGLDAGMGVMSGNELPGNYSFSFQGLHDSGLGLSLDYIKGLDRADSSGLLVRAGLLGSVFLGIPLSQFFIPYVGGGLGVKFNDLDEDTGFAWKVDGGVAAWLTDILYVKAGVMYDNIREVNYNPDLASSVKALMTQRGCDVSLTPVTAYHDYDYVVINEYSKNKGIYRSTVYPSYK